MSTVNLDSADLKAVQRGGLVSESVMKKIWDISNIPLELQDRLQVTTHGNEYAEWTQDELAAVDLTNKRVDGADAGATNTKTGARVGNHTQLSDKVVRVSDRAIGSDTLGFANALAYQLAQRQIELKRDIEGILLSNQASAADNGDATPGAIGALRSWIATNDQMGTGGVSGGFNLGTGIVAAATVGQANTITETKLRDACEACYVAGSNPGILMAIPKQIRRISEYMFTATARVANLQRETKGENNAASAMGSVNVFITDFGVTLEFVANRLQQSYSSIGGTVTTVGNIFILDMELLALSYLLGIQVKPLARTGSAENRQMTAHYTLKVGQEKGLAVISDVDPTVAMVA